MSKVNTNLENVCFIQRWYNSNQSFNLLCEIKVLNSWMLHCKLSVWYIKDWKVRYNSVFRWWITFFKNEPIMWEWEVKALQVLCIYVPAAGEELIMLTRHQIIIKYWYRLYVCINNAFSCSKYTVYISRSEATAVKKWNV